jgi:hypothetical protein
MCVLRLKMLHSVFVIAASSWNEEEEQLLDHVLPEIKSQHKDDYLDLSLDDEAHFLHEYQLLLS